MEAVSLVPASSMTTLLKEYVQGVTALRPGRKGGEVYTVRR